MGQISSQTTSAIGMVNITRVWLVLMKSVLLMRHKQGLIVGRRESPHQTSKPHHLFLSDRVIHEGLIPVTSLCVDTGVLLAQVGIVAKVEIMILNFEI